MKTSLRILSLGVKGVTYFPLGGHSRPEALQRVNIWCCHQLCTTAAKLGPISPPGAVSSACRCPPGLHSNPRFAKVCVTLDKYTQKLIEQLPFSLSLPPSPPFLDMPELHHSLLPLCDLSLWTRLRELFPPTSLSGSCGHVGSLGAATS